MASIPSAQVPASRRIHVKLHDGQEVIVPMWVRSEASTSERQEAGSLIIPAALMFMAVWIYDIDDRKILKNRTEKNFLVPLGVEEVTRQWLVDNRFVRYAS